MPQFPCRIINSDDVEPDILRPIDRLHIILGYLHDPILLRFSNKLLRITKMIVAPQFYLCKDQQTIIDKTDNVYFISSTAIVLFKDLVTISGKERHRLLFTN